MKWLRNMIIGLIVAMGVGIVAGVFALVVLLFPPGAEAGTLYTGAVSTHVCGGDYCEGVDGRGG